MNNVIQKMGRYTLSNRKNYTIVRFKTIGITAEQITKAIELTIDRIVVENGRAYLKTGMFFTDSGQWVIQDEFMPILERYINAFNKPLSEDHDVLKEEITKAVEATNRKRV